MSKQQDNLRVLFNIETGKNKEDIEYVTWLEEKVNVYDSLLRELRETYLYDVDDEGELKASISELLDLWHRVSKILNQ